MTDKSNVNNALSNTADGNGRNKISSRGGMGGGGGIITRRLKEGGGKKRLGELG